MNKSISETTLCRLDVQGFERAGRSELAEVMPWQRMAYGLCAAIVAAGTVTANPTLLFALVPIAALAIVLPLHPFDLIYNHGIRHLRKTGPLPRRGAPARFACGLGAVWVGATGWAFWADHTMTGYILGAALVAVATLVSTTDICIPSIIYRALFGAPQPRT